MILPWMSPVTTTATDATSTVNAPSFTAGRNSSVCSPLRRTRCHSAMPSMNAPPVRKAAEIVCGNVTRATLLVSTAPKSCSSARPLAWS
jgi:hypothetical protein